MKITDLFQVNEAQDSDRLVRDEIRELLLAEFGDKMTAELSRKELQIIAHGESLWELSLDETNQKDLDRIDSKFLPRFAYFDEDSGLCRIYSASKEKLVTIFKSHFSNITPADIKSLEDDGYLAKVA